MSAGRSVRGRPWLVGWLVLAACFVALTVLVAVGHGIVGTLDSPVERWVVERQTPGRTTAARALTHLGDPTVTVVGGVLLAGLTAVRSRRLGLAVLVAALVRPLLSTLVKDLVSRPRPALSQLVTAAGDSYPSGHASGAVVLWGLLPIAAWAWGASRRATAWLVALAGAVAVVVGCCRLYLGVHWLSDVVGGFLLGALILVPVAVVAIRVVPTMDR